MSLKKKSAPVLAHRDAKTGGAKRPTNYLTYSLSTALRDVKRLLCGALALLAARCAMETYAALVEHMDGWLISLPLCAISTLAVVWLWRQAEGGDGHDK